MKHRYQKFIIIFTVVFSVGFCSFACQASSVGSFQEKRIELPEGEYEGFFPQFSKGLAIFQLNTQSEQGGLYVSSNDGRSYRRKNAAWCTGLPETDLVNLAISSDGQAAAVYPADDAASGWKYVYVDADGMVHFPKWDTTEENPIVRFHFTKEGLLLACGAKQDVYQVNPKTGETKLLITTEHPATEIFCMGTIVGCLDQQRAYLYDLEAKTELPEHKLFSKFVRLYQAEDHEKTDSSSRDQNTAVSSGDLDSRKDVPKFGREKRIAVYVSPKDDQTVYLACAAGVFRYRYGGSTIEQMLDGRRYALKDAGNEMIAVRMTSFQEIQILFSGDELYSYIWKSN